MAACAVVLTIGASKLFERVLPFATTLQQSFARLEWTLAIGIAGGVVLGVLITHGLGSDIFSAGTRMVHALIAVPLALLILLGVIAAIS